MKTSGERLSLYHQSYGSGPPFIILHGMLGASGNWHTLSRTVFGDHLTTYTVDQRNHGRSPHSDRFSYPAMAEDLWVFLEEHDLTSTHLMGHSMGGKTAMYAALAFPQRIDRLVIADMAPKAYPPNHTYIFEALQAVDPSNYDRREDIDAALADAIPSRPVRQFLLKNLDYDGERYAWKMNLDAIHANYDQITKGLDTERTFEGPTLFVAGTNSDYVSERDLPQIRKNFPQAELVQIEGAGHWVHADAPSAFGKTVVDFLTG